MPSSVAKGVRSLPRLRISTPPRRAEAGPTSSRRTRPVEAFLILTRLDAETGDISLGTCFGIRLAAGRRSVTLLTGEDREMAKTLGIQVEDFELDGDASLWDVMRVALRAKETRPSALLLPAMLVMKANEIVAKVYQSSEEPRTLLVRTCTGTRKIRFNWYDGLLMLYRTAVLTLQKMEGTAVIFLGERTEKDAGRAMVCAMKWTARQFLEPPPRGAKFPETQDSISQPFYLHNEKVCWLSEVSTALQFS